MRRAATVLVALMALAMAIAIEQRPAVAAPTVRYVSPGAACAGATPCYATPQAAVDASDSGDEIRVAAAPYNAVFTRDVQLPFGGTTVSMKQVLLIDRKSLTIRGGYTTSDWATSRPRTNLTILAPLGIDAGRGRVISIVGNGTDTAVTVEGFEIRDGDYTGLGNPPGVSNSQCNRTGSDCGGGVYARGAALSLIANDVVNNRTSASSNFSDGGGVYAIEHLGLVVERSTFTANLATTNDGAGGAVYASGRSVVIQNSTFIENRALGSGGALRLFGNGQVIQVRQSIFQRNQANSSAFEGAGSAISVAGSYTGVSQTAVDAFIERNRFETNGGTAGRGRVISISAHAELINNIITGTGPGESAIAIVGKGVLRSNTYSGNGAPLAFAFVSSFAGATARTEATDTIIDGATTGFVAQTNAGQAAPEIAITRTLANGVGAMFGSLMASTAPPVTSQTGTITGPPALNPTTFLPSAGSPAIGAGTSTGMPAADYYGNPRIAPPTIGAVEVGTFIRLPALFRTLGPGW